MTFRSSLCLTALLACATAPPVLAQTAQVRPVRVPSAPSEEPRYVGVDFPSWPITQALGTATEPLSINGNGFPVCLPWEVVIAVSADARTCVCFAQTRTATVAAPTGDGGCVLTDPGGQDGIGACFTVGAGETKWKAPYRPLVEARAGAHLGICTVATSTTNGLGRALYPPCSTDQQCVVLTGAGSTCDLTTTASEREALSCAWGLLRSAEATNVYVDGGR